MTRNNILFDDWEVRPEKAFEHSKNGCRLCIVVCSFGLTLSIIITFFELGAIAAVPLFLISVASVYFQWLKVKNNHLIIKNNQIEVTDRYNKTVVYEVDINNLVLELRYRHHYRLTTLMMNFYDSENNLIFKYEDMFNHASGFGLEKTNWEKAIQSLGIKIIDNEEVIKNK